MCAVVVYHCMFTAPIDSRAGLETFPAAPVQMISQEGLHLVQPYSAGATFIDYWGTKIQVHVLPIQKWYDRGCFI